MSRVGAVLAAAFLMTLWLGPAAVADQEAPQAQPSTNDVPISLENTTMPIPDPDTVDHLASTGADVASLLQIGIALVVAGVLAVAVTRRPRGAA